MCWDLSKIQAGKVELREETVDLSKLVQDSISLMRDRAHKGVVTLVFDEDSSGPLVLADRRLIKQILLNLLTNAIKFTPASAARCRPGRLRGRAGYRHRHPGYSASAWTRPISSKPCRPMVRSTPRLSRKNKGTGPGAYPSPSRWHELHGGDLVVVSAPGKRTIASLPLNRALKTSRGGSGIAGPPQLSGCLRSRGCLHSPDRWLGPFDFDHLR